MVKIGVLALQGAFREHIEALNRVGAEAVDVRYAHQLEELDGIILPGGESTVMGKLLRLTGIYEPLRKRILDGMPVFGTCAGMILLAKEIDGGETPHLATMNIKVARNAFGRQIDSFSKAQVIEGIGDEPIEMVFIRAPYVLESGEGVEVMAQVDGRTVMVRQGNMLAAAFHPELTDNDSILRYFLSFVAKK